MEEATVEEQQIEATVEEAEPTEGAEEVEEEPQPPESPAPATAELEAAVTELRTTLEERDMELQTLRHQLASAMARYREALLATAPEVPVSGATPEEVEASLA